MIFGAGMIGVIVLVGLVARLAIYCGLLAMGLTNAAMRVRNPDNTPEFYGVLFLAAFLGSLAAMAVFGA